MSGKAFMKIVYRQLQSDKAFDDVEHAEWRNDTTLLLSLFEGPRLVVNARTTLPRRRTHRRA